MDDNVIDLNLIKKLNSIGFKRLNRSFFYKDLFVNNFYLNSETSFVNYMGTLAFSKNTPYEKKKVIIKILFQFFNS